MPCTHVLLTLPLPLPLLLLLLLLPHCVAPGTALGDPIEVGAALAVFATKAPRGQALELSAAKTTVGHAEPAAGAAGMLRAIFR